ncbi:hypothetical protein N9N28_00205 [Rubripirellula amarantea]|nr:hypothetical protein [Rubripirellula amarantea]
MKILSGYEDSIVGVRTNGGEINTWALERLSSVDTEFSERGFTHKVVLNSVPWSDENNHLVVVDLRIDDVEDKEFGITAWCFGRAERSKLLVFPKKVYQNRLSRVNEFEILLVPASSCGNGLTVHAANELVSITSTKSGAKFTLSDEFIESVGANELVFSVRCGDQLIGVASVEIK